MFEYRVGQSIDEVAALFGEGIRLTSRRYVEDPDTGNLLAPAGGLGLEELGRAYLLRWHGRPIPVEAGVVMKGGDGPGAYPLFTIAHVGTSSAARMTTRVRRAELTPEEAARVALVAAEACVVYESFREDDGPGTRVADPLSSGRELSPADFGYGEITRMPWGSR